MTSLIEKTISYVQSLMSQESTGHDWWHTQRVWRMAIYLAKSESQSVNEEVLILACLLHDVKDYKLSGSELAGPQAVSEWLHLNNADQVLIDQVVEIISTLSFKGQVHRPMKTIEGKLVQDADRLDAVGAIGIARAFAYGGAQGREIFNPTIPFRENLSAQAYKDKTLLTTSLNHFYEKLLKLNGHYNSTLANQIGAQRHEFLKTYLVEFLRECGATDSDFFIKLNQ